MAEEFTVAPMRRLLKKHGDLRVSEGAAEELRRAIGEYGSKIAGTAVAIAQEEGRKTVLERDVVAARSGEGGEGN
ncbi:MAG: NFYB/HAP3 family transcription factor subunit [Candidatus Bathyarchaeota archaeon]